MKKAFLNVLFLFLIVVLLIDARLLAANPQSFRYEKDSLMLGAQWITDHSEPPITDSLFYLDHPAPLLRTDFKIADNVAHAELFVTAAGYYETWLNGTRVGDQQLDPAWTDFSKRLYVTRLEVTSLVQKGKNSWGIMLGNGFYNPLPLRLWGGRNLRNDLTVGQPCMIAKLIVTHTDGSQEVFYTSDQWLTREGPVTRNNVYLGEWYDARKEIHGWNLAGASRKGWKPVRVTDGPGGRLEIAEFPPIRITKWIEPISILQQGENNQIIDFGQNFAGIIKIKVQAEAGDTIRFRYGELLYPDGNVNPMTTVCGQIKRAGVGGPGAPAIAEQEDVYIASGTEPEFFQPRFTFHAFRYVEVSGKIKVLAKDEIQAGRMNTDVNPVMNMVSSSSYLNKLNQNCQWTFLSNLQSVQSDCPAREKFGYGGDINATVDAYIYNFDMQGIYRKAVYDWVDAMKADQFVDTAPFVGIEYCGLSWESAFLFLQHALWLHYGDTQLVKDLYAADQAWMRKIARIHPELVVDKGLSDHESLAKVPVELTGTCHYYQIANIMAKFASLNEDPVGVVEYTALAEKIRERIVDLFWNTPEIEVPNQQTLLSTLLASGVLSEGDQLDAIDRLLEALKGSDYHVTTGIFGTKYLLDVLSKYGYTDIAYRVVNQPGFPGWKNMIDNGATTIWETWKESDNTFSHNHPMFGSVSEWYIKWLGGIQPDPEAPARNRVILQPRPVVDLDSVLVEKYFPSGNLRSSWWWSGNNLIFEFTIPADVSISWISGFNASDIFAKRFPEGWRLPEPGDLSEISLSKPGLYRFVISDIKENYEN
jgi:alpha-L-rhamnosidase